MEQLDQLIDYLDSRYGVQVIVCTLEQRVEIAKILDGTIYVNRDSRGDPELFFTIAHLFGHIVQASNAETPEGVFKNFQHLRSLKLMEEYRRAVWDYEFEAYQIGKTLLQTVFGEDQTTRWDARYQIYIATDFEVFWSYLCTGKKIPVPDFNAALENNYAEQVHRYSEPLASLPLPHELELKKIKITVH